MCGLRVELSSEAAGFLRAEVGMAIPAQGLYPLV